MTRTIIKGSPVHKWKVSIYRVDPTTAYHTLVDEIMCDTSGSAERVMSRVSSTHDNIHTIKDEVVVYE